jgi:hypothetical protein
MVAVTGDKEIEKGALQGQRFLYILMQTHKS